MIQDLAIVHRRKPQVFTGVRGPVWSTCLRSLAFVTGKPTFELLPDDEIHTQENAYRFLLEILCGLESPIVGETEVFGQFKIFAAEWTEREPHRAALIQKLLNDVRSLRAQHLSHLGTQSYGSWLRRHLSSSRIHVLGGGHLAKEVLPYLAQRASVVVHTRRPERVDFHPDVHPLTAHGFDGGALVIAAPLTAAEIRAWLNGAVPTQVFDLRDNSSDDRVCPDSVPLKFIFGDIEQTKTRLRPVVERIKSEIQVRSQVLAAQEKVRPQGWDDLCA